MPVSPGLLSDLELIPSGVAFHHAGINSEDRKSIEEMFGDCVNVVCTTSTLSQGVNLPARLVVIMNTSAYRNGRTRNYNKMEIEQMIGRAGRPQFDSNGVAVIMT